MAAAQKETIYIDIDDEITSIIEKVQNADNKIVALVLPKRAAVLQSVVNMKLLKRTADEAKKHVVLITSEAGLLPLAGAVGLNVAKTLQTKPAIPPAPKLNTSLVTVDDEVSADEDVPLDPTKSIGVLAGAGPEEETIEVGSPEDDVKEPTKTAKKSLNKKLKVPNFNKFRTRLIAGVGGLILVLILWYMAAFTMPRAHIVIKTDSTNLTSNIDLTTKPDLDAVDLENKVVPSYTREIKKTDTEKVAATGDKDVGTKATGTVTVKNCEDSKTHPVAVGTLFAGGGKNYYSTEAKTVPASGVSGGNIVCGSVDIPVAAAGNGESYNQGATTYTTNSKELQGKFTITGSAMAGGTTKMVKVVSQNDVDGAKQKLADRTGLNVDQDLKKQLEDEGYFVIPDSIVTAAAEVTSNPAVGAEATEVTVTSTVVATMIGVKKDDLKKLVAESVKDQFDPNQQMIQDEGLDAAIFRITDKKADGTSSISLQTIAVVIPKIDENALKQAVAGKKRGETLALIQGRPGVKEVTIDYSPFWVYSTPKKTGKIVITFEQVAAEN